MKIDYNDIEAKALVLNYGINLTSSALAQFNASNYLLKRRIYSNYDDQEYLTRDVPQEITFPSSKTVASVILKQHTPMLIDYQNNQFVLYNKNDVSYKKEVEFSLSPQFYGRKLSNGDFAEQYITKLFGHSIGVFMSTQCFFADTNVACKFCSIKANEGRPKDAFSMVDRKLTIEAILLALSLDKSIDCVFISGGVVSSDFDNNFTYYSDFALQLKQQLIEHNLGNIEITLNTYPPLNLELFEKLRNTNIAIMLSIELFDYEKRKQICPGKSRLFNEIGIEKLFRKAVSVAGFGRVLAFVIEGIEDKNKIKEGVKYYAEIGVCIVVHVLHVDPGTWIYNNGFTSPSYEEIIDLASYASKQYHEYGLDSSVLYGGRSSLDSESSRLLF